MHLTILGSGTGVPSLTRGSPGALVTYAGTIIMLDSGPGTLQKMLHAGVTYKDINYVLYSHVHPDHVADLVALIFACKYQDDPRTKDLHIIGGPRFRSYFDGLARLYGRWVTPDTFQIYITEVGADTVYVGPLWVSTLPLQHARESVGYRIESPEKKVVAYSGDTDYCENLVVLAQEADVLVVEASFPEGHKIPGHLTPSLAGRAARTARCRRLVLTHLYPPCDETDVVEACRREYGGEIVLAEDLMTIKI